MNGYQGIWFYNCPSLFWDTVTLDSELVILPAGPAERWAYRAALPCPAYFFNAIIGVSKLGRHWRKEGKHVCTWTPEAEHELDKLPNNSEPLLLQTENEDL